MGYSLTIHKSDVIEYLRVKYPNTTEQELKDFYNDLSWGYAGKYYAIISILKDRGVDIDSTFELAKTIKIEGDVTYPFAFKMVDKGKDIGERAETTSAG